MSGRDFFLWTGSQPGANKLPGITENISYDDLSNLFRNRRRPYTGIVSHVESSIHCRQNPSDSSSSDEDDSTVTPIQKSRSPNPPKPFTTSSVTTGSPKYRSDLFEQLNIRNDVNKDLDFISRVEL